MRHALTLGAAMFALGLVVTIAPQRAVAGDAGSAKDLFVTTHKCQTCHSLSTAGIEAKMKKGPMAGPDLAGVGETRDADWIVKFVKGEENIDGKKHKKPFKGTDEELRAIVDWVLEQAAP